MVELIQRNTATKTIDSHQNSVINWIKSFAEKYADIVALKIRRRELVDGIFKHHIDQMLLPAYFTWDFIVSQHKEFCRETGFSQNINGSNRSLRRIVRRNCPLIGIRSPWSSVCNDCTMYWLGCLRMPLFMTQSRCRHTLSMLKLLWSVCFVCRVFLCLFAQFSFVCLVSFCWPVQICIQGRSGFCFWRSFVLGNRLFPKPDTTKLTGNTVEVLFHVPVQRVHVRCA